MTYERPRARTFIILPADGDGLTDPHAVTLYLTEAEVEYECGPKGRFAREGEVVLEVFDNEEPDLLEHEADLRFRTLGDLVPPEMVPGLVRAGATVWSWGYGETPGWEDPDGFNTIEEEDLHLFEEEGYEVAAAEWGPFRVDWNEFLNETTRF